MTKSKQQDKRPHEICKIVFVGDYSHDLFYDLKSRVVFYTLWQKGNINNEEYMMPYFDPFNEVVKVGSTTLEMSIWETPSQDEYSRLRPLSYPDTNVFVLDYNIASLRTLLHVKEWYEETQQAKTGARYFLLGYGKDWRDDEKTRQEVMKRKTEVQFISTAAGEAIANFFGFDGFCECKLRSREDVFKLLGQIATVARKDVEPEKKKPQKQSFLSSLFFAKKQQEPLKLQTPLSGLELLKILFPVSTLNYQEATLIHPNVINYKGASYLTITASPKEATDVLFEFFPRYEWTNPQLSYEVIAITTNNSASATSTGSEKTTASEVIRFYCKLSEFYITSMDRFLNRVKRIMGSLDKLYFTQEQLLKWLDPANAKAVYKNKRNFNSSNVLENALVKKEAEEVQPENQLLPICAQLVCNISLQQRCQMGYELMTFDLNAKTPNWSHPRLHHYSPAFVEAIKAFSQGSTTLDHCELTKIQKEHLPEFNTAEVLEAVTQAISPMLEQLFKRFDKQRFADILLVVF